ncbi:MAG: stage II sporulation protein P [Faecousia sp.]
MRSARKFGISVVLLTILFRLFELGLPQRVLQLVQWPSSGQIEKETERAVQSFSFPFPFESSPPADYSPEPVRPLFTAADAQAVAVVNSGREEPDCAALMAEPLNWQLVSDGPTVLIVHTHTSESYEKNGADYQETAAYRTLDENYNMLSIGDRVAQLLEAEGIQVIHDREFHDYPSYNTAYTHARKAVQGLLKQNPGILLVLDLHRDASEGGGGQLRTHAQVNGVDSAQLMLVLGTGNAGLPNEGWENNLCLALKLQATLEEQSSGICRPISLRGQRFNQDLAPYSLLVEVGAAGDSHEAALVAAEQLAKALAALKYGTAPAG